MSQRGLQFAKSVVLIALVPALLVAYRYGPPPRRTGAPGESTCWAAGCHQSVAAAFFPNSTALSVDFAGSSSYTPGGPKQRWTVKVDDPAGLAFGFELSARVEGTNAQAGHFNAIAGGDPVIVVPLSFVEYVEQAQPKSSGSFSFEWTPPPTDVGNIKVYLAANAANNNGFPSGDRIHTASFTLSPAVSSGRPTIGHVANIWSGQPAISDGSWIYIKGTNLAQSTRLWRPEEIVGGQLPRSLDGVSVKINNADAFVYYISPGQINVQVPGGAATGPVPVEVTTAAGTSDPVMVTKQQIAPALLVWSSGVAAEPDRYVGAVSTAGTFLGKAGLLRPIGVTTRPAKPGEVVLLFATGCGPTNPPTVAGQVIGTPAPALASPVALRVGGQPAANAGYLISAGLCQFNATIPANLPDGDYLVDLDIGGNPAQRNVLITVQK